MDVSAPQCIDVKDDGRFMIPYIPVWQVAVQDTPACIEEHDGIPAGQLHIQGAGREQHTERSHESEQFPPCFVHDIS